MKVSLLTRKTVEDAPPAEKSPYYIMEDGGRGAVFGHLGGVAVGIGHRRGGSAFAMLKSQLHINEKSPNLVISLAQLAPLSV